MGVYEDLKRLKIGKLFSDPGAFAGDVGRVAQGLPVPAAQTVGSIALSGEAAARLIRDKAAREGITYAEAAAQLLRAGVIAGRATADRDTWIGAAVIGGLILLLFLSGRR